MSDDKLIIDPNLGLSGNDKIKHDQSVYRDAKIERHESKGEEQARANSALREIGTYIQTESSEAPILKNATYLGSAAVHVYQSAIMGTMFFISQVDPMTTGVPEWTADKALIDLRKHMMTGYGRKMGAPKRSGF